MADGDFSERMRLVAVDFDAGVAKIAARIDRTADDPMAERLAELPDLAALAVEAPHLIGEYYSDDDKSAYYAQRAKTIDSAQGETITDAIRRDANAA